LAVAVGMIGGEMNSRGFFGIMLLIVVFAGAGFAAEWAFRHLSRHWRLSTASLHFDTVRERLIAIAARLVMSAGQVLAFALGSIGAFLIFDWPPILRDIVIGYLTAVVIFRLASVILDFLLSPPNSQAFGSAERFRIIPVTSDVAHFWARRIAYAVGWFALGWVTLSLLAELGVSLPTRQLIAYALGLVLLAIGIEAVWRHPVPATALATRWHRTRSWLWTIYFLGLWLSWVAGAMRLFWLAAVVAGLPFAAWVAQRAVNNVLRPAGTDHGGSEIPGVLAAIIDRGIRALFIIAAIVILAWAWGVDLTMMAERDTLPCGWCAASSPRW
jgi:hypothetical protein